ncbi:MAG: outer membrane beta-barrel protein [Ignavibacteriales bacterium]|nr:outer membrane beta-barrel protein [Ignavibacteriales bacterium]
MILLITIFSGAAFAQSNGFGLGIILGEPTGISVKYWTTSSTAFDFGLGYSLKKNSRLHLHADYLFHVKNLAHTTENISFYYGPGARLRVVENGDSRLGFRFDVGLVWIPRNAPVDVFLEIAPLLDIIPQTDFSVNGGIGIRYFFN